MNLVFAIIKPPWQFPVVVDIGNRLFPIHQICDTLAYFLGFRLYLYLRKHSGGEKLYWDQGVCILLGCIFGALIGAKILAWMEAPALYWAMRNDPNFWFGGKTIVGALCGGWAGVEIAKKVIGVTSSTGDLCVYPLIVGMCIGRIGCFLTGISDNTCGIRTTLPWGVDFGDGIPRHPAQIYEIMFLIGLGYILWLVRPRLAQPGSRFRWFMIAYLSFRLFIDFIKPHWTVFGGLSGIQWGCVITLIYCFYSLKQTTRTKNSHG